ncbi:hydroxysteroid 11-beta-dehydrogenase 1-like protein B [Clavelina lepadiformis]|uniref:Uncharacterized protein n=1 Tax=Clavelina lepadiformis TaxID=159417 RepID=A0ABP0FCQ7_CLALP
MGFIRKSAFVLAIAMLVYFFIPQHVNLDEVRGKRFLITGASQNIGMELAYKYSKLGAKIVITARREKQLQEVVENCKKLGALEANYIVADMSDIQQTKKLIEKTVNIVGGLDYLVLNHALLSASLQFWDGSNDQLNTAQKMMTINYLSYIHLSSYATPYLVKSNGRLVVVSSLAGHVNNPYMGVYGASKAAINQFYSSLRLEMALQKKYDYSITICLLGAIDTSRPKQKQKEVNSKMNVARHPVDETAQEIVDAAAARSAYVFVPKWTAVTGIIRAFTSETLENIYLQAIFGNNS